jgi:leucyl-tRNA synthetase
VDQGIGQATTQYRLRDWGIGRQRYWGVPIPIIYCPDCGVLPVPEKDLPVILPEDVGFDQPGNPLSNHPTWKNVSCPECGIAAQRETDTFDTFFESSWYFARFCDPHNSDQAFSPELAQHWLPVNQYVGGIEHAVLHLLYARFFTKALKKCGYWNISEPFKGLFTQGMVCHKTFQLADGTWILPEQVAAYSAKGQEVIEGRSEKMSKSKCNVVGVTQMVEIYGADAVRLFVLSDTPPQKDLEWTEEGIEGAWRYVRRIWGLFHDQKALCLQVAWPTDMPKQWCDQAITMRRVTHQSLLELQHAMDGYSLNKYIALLRQWSNTLADLPIGDKAQGCALSDFGVAAANGEPLALDKGWGHDASNVWALRESWTYFVQAMAPIMPHLAEEIGSYLGFSPGIHRMPWPKVDVTLLQDVPIAISVQVNGKHRGVVYALRNATEADVIHALRSDIGLQKYVQGTWKRTIFVPGRMISIILD